MFFFRYNSCLSLGIEDEGKLVGALCLNDYPNVKSLPRWSWAGWLKTMFGLEMLTPVNSKWIQLLLFDVSYVANFLTPLMEVLFLEQRKIRYVAIAIPPGIKNTPFLTQHSTRIPPRGNYFFFEC